jgi:uncharacterized protein
MKIKFFFYSFLLFLNLVHGNNFPKRPEPFRFVNDFTLNKQFFSNKFRDELHSYLLELAKEKGTQIVVVAIDDLQGQDASDYAIGLLNDWQIGQKGKDNGVLILIKPKTNDEKGKIFITTGYGMEGELPDIFLGRVINDVMLPSFKTGNIETGIWNGVLEIVNKIHPDFTYNGKMETYEDDVNISPVEFLIIFVVLLIIFLFIRGRSVPVVYTGTGSMYEGTAGWGSGRSGGFSGGSSFGGFGGRGGGGGAGGSW